MDEADVGVRRMEKIKIKCFIVSFLIILISSSSFAHDTTHIHPLITAKIAKLIQSSDSVDKSYNDIYELVPVPKPGINTTQRLYWGTDFDAGKPPEELTQEWLLGEEGLSAFHAPLNVMNGVVQEDVPSLKVLNHFYQAKSGTGLLTDKFISQVGWARFMCPRVKIIN